MKGRSEFTREEATRIRALLHRKGTADRDSQKKLRRELRSIGFHIQDWSAGPGFTRSDFDDRVSRKVIQITEADAHSSGPPTTKSAPFLDPKLLTENEIIDAVCLLLEKRGFELVERASTSQTGVDIVGCRDGLEIRVEAKGATSSKSGTARYGSPFSSSQVSTHVAKALYVAAAVPQQESLRSAIALPDLPKHRKYTARIEDALRVLDIGIFWVTDKGQAELDAPWDL